jgi:putative colanic acid biosynthesis UDP-glucose lipid carrier transferase
VEEGRQMINRIHAPVFRIISIDLLLLNIINIFFVYSIKKYRFGILPGNERYLLLLIVFNTLWIIINILITRYRMEISRSILIELKKILLNFTLFIGLTSVFAFYFKSFQYSRLIIFGTILVFFLFSTGAHLISLYILRWLRKKPSHKRNILIVGDNYGAVELYEKYSEMSDGNDELIVYIENESYQNKVGSELIVGKLADAGSIFERMKIDELYIVLSSSNEDEIKNLVSIADHYGTRVRMVPPFYRLFERHFEVGLFADIPIINVNEIPLDNHYNVIYKRFFDIAASLSGIILLAPVMLVIVLLIKLTSRGPVMYSPERIGMAGNIFKMHKFRTMNHCRENHDDLSTKKNDRRVTHLGGFLRRSNMDELPQLFNVLKGEMSIVGPRPHRVYLDRKLQNEVGRYMIRHYIKPGITGWAQVNGWRGPTETSEQKTQRTQHDLWYLRNWTFWLDIKIVFLTIFGRKSRLNAF